MERTEVTQYWCGHANDYFQEVGGKPWSYLLVPHNEIVESRMLEDYERFVFDA